MGRTAALDRGGMVTVSNADRVVFPEVKRTKGDVVAYYERVAPKAFEHIVDRPLSIRRYPKGLAAPGFFQKNVPPHYPESIERFAVPRSAAASKKHPPKKTSADVTMYPLVRLHEHLPYLANQGAIELHVPTARVPNLFRPDRIVFDLDPPSGAVALVRRAARLTRDALAELGLDTVPIATGSKGYHVVSPILPSLSIDVLGVAIQKLAALLVAKHPDELTMTFRIAQRGERVFVDFLRNYANATVIAPYSLRARPRATVATPLAWDELDTLAPDAFSIADVERLMDRPDSLADLAKTPSDPEPFVAAVDEAFEESGLVLETFDRFRS
jgi:bifunctional non-homologous end joining protein LigD